MRKSILDIVNNTNSVQPDWENMSGEEMDEIIGRMVDKTGFEYNKSDREVLIVYIKTFIWDNRDYRFLLEHKYNIKQLDILYTLEISYNADTTKLRNPNYCAGVLDVISDEIRHGREYKYLLNPNYTEAAAKRLRIVYQQYPSQIDYFKESYEELVELVGEPSAVERISLMYNALMYDDSGIDLDIFKDKSNSNYMLAEYVRAIYDKRIANDNYMRAVNAMAKEAERYELAKKDLEFVKSRLNYK